MKEKVLFIDRDGTLIIEPPTDYQVDSLEKLEYYPGVFRWLSRIQEELDYALVMVTNQDGLGTASFPEDTFWPAHNKMLQALSNENISFKEILIDRSFPAENKSTRKPDTGLLQEYIYGPFDLENSFVIGDRASDIQLAKNLKCKSIRIGSEKDNNAELTTSSWRDIYYFLKDTPRIANINRNTKETQIDIQLDLDGTISSNINSGLSFLDHMLDQLWRHGNIGLQLSCKGDLNIDEHHTVEDIALVLGEAFSRALGNKKAIERYGFLLPMDEALAQVAIDFGGRPQLVWDCNFNRAYTGDVPTDMWKHFFKSFCDTAKCNLNIQCTAENDHHKIESIFKSLAKAIKMAVSKTENYTIPSTKGIL